ncbi:hypothetical protein M9H77_05374 [Catharanthus roseus]|uniref:Uncharacterized protein n=1 Tax=Catharanthus roseus TaxID=4058 RepID=A0ACC0CHD0_CATRO|nr:hypothetical protein M9H77_05374 [Catharanthus roseus]
MRYYSYSRLVSQSLLRSSKSISRNPYGSIHFISLRFLGLNNRKPTESLIQKAPFFSPKSLNFTTSAEAVKQPVPSENVSTIVDELSQLTLLEVSDLTEELRKRLKIEEMPVMAIMMPGMGFSGGVGMTGKGGAASKTEEKVEKTAFDLKLEGGFDAAAKIKIIKEVRTFTALGLKEAKELVEKAPTLLKKGVAKEEAEKIIEKMKEVGAKVTME